MKEFFKDPVNWLRSHRSQTLSIGTLATFIFLLLFFLGMVISPFLISADTIHLGEYGVVGGEEHSQIIESNITNPLAKFYYRMGDLNCHQHESRSWHLNGNQLPFCARDTAIFFGLAIGALIMVLYAFELNFIFLILAFVPIGLDGGLQLVTSYESTNFLRFITGTIAGIATGMAIGIIIQEAGGLMRWRKEVRASKRRMREEPPEENAEMNDGPTSEDSDERQAEPEEITGPR